MPRISLRALKKRSPYGAALAGSNCSGPRDEWAPEGLGVAVVDVAVEAVDDADDFVHPIFRRAPGEDRGTDTSRLYRYQAEVAAQACLAMLTRDEIEYVVCEWHEDFAIAFKNGAVELVPVKHRQYHRTPWNVGDLCKDGGLAHLFNSWLACGSADNTRLRLTTNGALNTGKGNTAALARMCGPDPEVTAGVDAMATTVARYSPAAELTDVSV
ncbi:MULTISPECIES: dsDNA nuclease domain-containing protein [Streptomyces]|uniref:dsDNA nuclease domain-containing protein n=1 Tax=Streptomyces TaxID=1883 RepID=UPI00287F89E7|nr:dsDNA nuclease domain-containing protein [Streptomyces sp. CGMCC 4.1456]WNF62529.1 dsDNA nuclease domain-containing protein [Streptomyces sp. CGMCC 4.1456]